MSVEESHENKRIACAYGESTESLTASTLILLLQVLRELRESLCFIANSVLFCRSGCTPSAANHRLNSVRISMGERRERGNTICAYGGVNGVTFRLIAHSSASGSASAL